VLLTAYTHSAVDTILLKLLDFDDCRTAFMRLSSSIGAVHEAVRHRVLTRRDANQSSAANSDWFEFLRLCCFVLLFYLFVSHHCSTFSMYSTVAELQQLVGKAKVLATTCLGVQHPVLLNRANSGGFDVCIVDEASQVTQPVCLGPLRYANSFVLVGDHYQLPPVFICVEGILYCCNL
jgi:DNA replication ATP-dependent helicase Dna2